MERGPEFAEFVAARGDELVRTAALLIGRVEGAEDLTQEALARLFRHWDRVSRDGDVEAYLHRIMVNLARDRWRRGSRVLVVADVPDVAQPEQTSAVAERDRLLAGWRSWGDGSVRCWCCGSGRTGRCSARPRRWAARQATCAR